MKTTHRITLTVGVLISAAIGVPLAGPTIAISHATAIQEDDPGWDCRTMGDRICGPTNSNLVAAGCYNDGAQLVAPWPCHVVVDPMTGEADVYTG